MVAVLERLACLVVYRYHGDSNIPGMMGVVVPLHEELERGATTKNEETFKARSLFNMFNIFIFSLLIASPFAYCKHDSALVGMKSNEKQ